MSEQWRTALMVSMLLILSLPIGAEESTVPVWSVGDRWTFNKTDGPTQSQPRGAPFDDHVYSQGVPRFVLSRRSC